MRPASLAFVCSFIVLSTAVLWVTPCTVAPVDSGSAAADAPDVDLLKRLERGREDLREGRTREGVKELRKLLANHPGSAVATTARDSLAREGFGLRSEVVLRDSRKVLSRLQGRDISEFVGRTEDLHSRLELFFRQTYSETHGQEFRLVVLDSRARFRKEFPQARRRSTNQALDTGWTNFPRAEVTVFWDDRIKNASPQAALDVLFENAAREMARTLSRLYTERRGLPEGFEVGLAEYLAVRLFPEKLVGIDRTLEEIVQGLARIALPRRGLDRLAGFRGQFSSAPPDRKLGPAAYGLWVAASYSLVDCLLNGSLSADTKADPPEEPRNAALQALLRAYERQETKKGARARTREGDAASFLRLVERHFELDVTALHEAWKEHLRRYPVKQVDFDIFSEF